LYFLGCAQLQAASEACIFLSVVCLQFITKSSFHSH
jgi:hypothetical protein